MWLCADKDFLSMISVFFLFSRLTLSTLLLPNKGENGDLKHEFIFSTLYFPPESFQALFKEKTSLFFQVTCVLDWNKKEKSGSGSSPVFHTSLYPIVP